MPNSASLFRDKARQAAAGQLAHDDALRVMRPRFWLAGLALAALCAGAVAFGFVFTVPVTVQGRGILLSAGGVIDVVANTSGQITEIAARPGALLGAGAVVARIGQPDLELQLEAARAAHDDAARSHDQLRAFQAREAAASARAQAQRLDTLDGRLRLLESRRTALAERRAGFADLARRGAIARDRLLDAESDLMAVESSLADARDERAQLEAAATARRIDAEAQLLRSGIARDEAARKVAALQTQLERLQEVRAPFGGRVVELRANTGQIVQNGSAILALERDPDAAPILIAYVAGFEAKRVRHGMAVEIAPASTTREEQGFIRGRVVRVSEAPSSSAGMMRRLQNDRLVDRFMSQIDTPVEVEVAIETDAAGAVLWSTPAPDGDRAARRVENGTLAEVTFTLAEMPLAALAVQALRGLSTEYGDDPE
ncbi:MAG: NHLP bacteriocin system secretion protein [Rubellimicrobium sp.]|nr:NHLP bacteriocin system secretion protein [Rubellimicrobium sp.]